MTSSIVYLHAQSPLHMGTGRAEGTIDLPHAREAHTGYPVAPGSGVKGVLRSEFEGDQAVQRMLFGGEAFQGALMVADGLLLCLPVRSMFGTFAWVTSPYLLDRYDRARQFAGLGGLFAGPAAWRPTPGVDDCITTPDSGLVAAGQPVFLHDLDLLVRAKSGLATLASTVATAVQPDAQWGRDFRMRLAVVSDAVMGYLAEVAMDVRARVRLADDSKTVVKGQLWYEESLPTESILFSVVAADPSHDETSATTASGVMDAFVGAHKTKAGYANIQLGGKATVGRGWVRTAVERAAAGG